MQRAAISFVIDPAVLGRLDADPARVADKLSAAYLMTVAARTIKDVSHLSRAAAEAREIVPTLTLDTEIRFRSAEERNAFITEFSAHLAELVSKYDCSETNSGRSFRLFTAAYPHPDRKEEGHDPSPENASA